MALDVSLLIGGDVLCVRIFDGDRDTIGRGGEPLWFAAGVGVKLNEVATCDEIAVVVRFLHLGDSHTVLVHLHLVAKLISTLVLAVEDNVYQTSLRRPRHIQTTANVESQQIAHECLVAVVVDKGPVLRVGRHAHQVTGAGKRNTIRFFGKAPAGVSSPANLQGVALNLRPTVGTGGSTVDFR